MATLWNTVASLARCQWITVPAYGRMGLFKIPTDDSHWLVGRYNDLTGLATALRTNAALRDLLTEHQVRLGLRDSDRPPADLARKPRYGSTVPGREARKDFTAARSNPLASSVHAHQPVSPNRRGDREQNVKEYWDTQTPQSHHIVEFNNLETLGVSRKVGTDDMDYLQLPAVLLAAEFHQRYISSILKPAQQWSKSRLQADIVGVYRLLYQGRSELFAPLCAISRVILKAAGLKVD